jgi:hypothetical protein
VSRTVFLVPRRRDNGPRDAIWEYCKTRWARLFPDWQIYEGHHNDGPFNRSAAVNVAAEEAGDWDVGIVIDSDIIESQANVVEAVRRAREAGEVTWAHRRWRGMTEAWTKRILDDRRDFGPELPRDEIDLLVDRTNPVSWSCCIAIPRTTFDHMGGFDERFEGWGFEDMAFQSLVVGLYPWSRVEGDVVHLWHPRSEERIIPGQGRLTATKEYVVNARLGRRYMVAVRRDHGMTDRLTPSDAAEMERDIANLMRDDAAYKPVVARHKLPDWSDWWPTLEELRVGAIAHRAQKSETDRSITLIVHSGGDAKTWPDRREYLSQSLLSLSGHVTGPIVQRVVYSDWGPEVRRELEEIADSFGFYVAGPPQHVGYTASMRLMWKYLAERAKGAWVFSVEDDFLYSRDVDLQQLQGTMEEQPNLRQLALLREAYYPRELEVGGVIQSLKTPTILRNHRANPYVEHRDHWTANPSLFRRSLTKTAWPIGDSSERRFGDLLLRDPQAAFAYWGSGEPWISHIGATRAGSSY